MRRARVYTMSGREADTAEGLIKGICFVNENPCEVLFDSGATHSFISFDCAKKLELPIVKVSYKLIVSTPTSPSVITSQMCPNCILKVLDPDFKIDLICLPLHHLDVILGMDWMSHNHVIIDCHKKTISINSTETPNLVLTTLEVTLVSEIDQILVVREFPEVFPDDIPGLPPTREVEFSIDLVPGAGPISMAPYRMSQIELAELKKQLEELLEKKFIRPSVSPWGAPVLFVKKKDQSFRMCIDYPTDLTLIRRVL
ncbi:MAG: retroviral-like aspartic protease family protein [Sweet potato little leaf phytoplasma]|nr:retroviral-like aspartic protease family protein [Sweet potato little leaf phytoplasma]